MQKADFVQKRKVSKRKVSKRKWYEKGARKRNLVRSRCCTLNNVLTNFGENVSDML